MGASADVVVVGAGSAGCVLAARLSEDPAVDVLLLEAGPDFRGEAFPPALLDGTRGPSIDTATDWGLTGRSGPGGRTIDLPRGRVAGGCSTVNATFALRGSPADYDAWAAAGNPGWSFADLLPAFVRLERDLDFGSAVYHGDNGPTPIRRYAGEEQSSLAAAGAAALEAAGLPRVGDHNAPGAVGVGPLPVNTVGRRRIGAALAYLDPARDRPNLTIRGDAQVQRVLAHRGVAVGVELVGGEVVEAGEVIVSAGAYHSPVLLLRSGIGAAADVRALGLDVVADLPGVGRNLHDHPAVSIDLPCAGPLVGEPVFQVVGTAHSSAADPHRDPPDLQLLVGGPYDDGGNGAVGFVGAAVLKPRSRGSVRVTSLDPGAPPRIDLGYFSDSADLDRLVEGFGIAEDAVSHPALQAVTGGGRFTPRLDGVPELRRHIVADAWTYHHPVGTCAMGPKPDEGAVVDTDGRVHGVEALSVVDASILPEIPSANTNLPTIAAAEHVAARRRAAAPVGARSSRTA